MAFKRINSLLSNLGRADSVANTAGQGQARLQRSRSAIQLGGGAAPADGGPPRLPEHIAAGPTLVPRRSLSNLRDDGSTSGAGASTGKPDPSKLNVSTTDVATPGGRPPSPSRASPGRSNVGGRPITTVATPTVTDSKGRVRDPGHVQLQSSAEEQKQYGVGPVLGHSPQVGVRPASRTIERETGAFPDGRPFDIKAVRSPATPAGQDKMLKDAPIRHDHGHMTPEQAERFKSFEGQPASPEYQTVRDNCVTGYDKFLSAVLDRPPLDPPVGTRPQDIAEANRNVRTDGSDIEPKSK